VRGPEAFDLLPSMNTGHDGSMGTPHASSLDAVGKTLRSRRMLREKVVIMSNEARASAMIIGSLPVFLGAVLFLVSPDCIGMMFSTNTGRFALVGAALWMLLGVQVMRKMLNFDA